MSLIKPALYDRLPKWNHSKEDLKILADELIKDEKALYDYIASVTEPTIENVLEKYADFMNKNSLKETYVDFYSSVATDKELRDESNDLTKKLVENSIEQESRVDVFKAFKTLKESVDNGKIKCGDPETKRYLEKIVRTGVRNGLDLPEEKRQQVKKLQMKLNELCIQFSKTMNEEKSFLLFTEEELDGVPQDVISSFDKETEGGVEKLKMTFKYPDVLPVLKYSHNEETRRKATIGNQNKCPENAPVLKKIIEVRYQLAKLLNYETYADYVLEERLAKRRDSVLSFLEDLRGKLDGLGKRDLGKLLEFKNEDLEKRGLPKQDKFYAWDSSYYHELLLKEKYKVDHIKISEYFPLDYTVSKMLGIYETLFDIKFEKLEHTKDEYTWHEDVQQFAVYKNIKFGKPSNEYIGCIYFDLHPREGKYGHAANFNLEPGFSIEGGSRNTPSTALVCNFTKPTKEKPSLLNHGEVVTFFHELGHGIHSLLSKTRYSRFHGTRVERDFVEAPSQMLEFWTWTKGCLKLLSSHFETGEQIPDDLVDQIIKSKHVNTSLFTLRQLHFGFFDMHVHSVAKEEDLDKLDLTETWHKMRREISFSIGAEGTIGYASFGHIAGGYEAGYYGYLYSDVFATDMFYTLFKEDPMNVDNGIRYRDIVLKRGGSVDSIDSLKELLGRSPNSDAFMQEIFEN